MKAMISQPMNGKIEEQIRAEREETIKQLEAKGYEVVDTVFSDFTDQGNVPLKYLAKSLEAIADVDLVFFMPGWEKARGCRIEHRVCVDYGVPFETAKCSLKGDQVARPIDEFTALCKPLNEWLQKNYHPHAKIIIETNYAEIVEGVTGISFKVKD